MYLEYLKLIILILLAVFAYGVVLAGVLWGALLLSGRFMSTFNSSLVGVAAVTVYVIATMPWAIMTVGNLISKSDNKQPTTQQSMTTKQLSDRLTAALEEYPEVEQSYVVIKDAQGNLYPVTSVSYDEDGVTMVADTIQNVNK